MTIPEPTKNDKEIDLAQRYRAFAGEHPYSMTDSWVAAVLRRAYHAERDADALRAKLHNSDRIGTHYDGCWDSGQRHYGCAVAEIAKLRARVAELEAKVKQ